MKNSLWLLPLLLMLSACTAFQSSPAPKTGPVASPGPTVWQGEYRFTPPPPPWGVLELDESDYSIAFFRACDEGRPGQHPCESTLAYDEEPFGYSRDLVARQKEFFRRFLWAARVEFEKPNLKTIQALGGEALLAETVAHERVLKDKALVQVIFAYRGERVVAFYLTQWRPVDQPFDREQLQDLDEFVASFSFVRPSFYQRLSTNRGAGTSKR